MTNVTTTIANGSTYKTTEIKANGAMFGFMLVEGTSNYISVMKLTNNPFKTIGKEFKTWGEVESAYASPDMQIAILSAKSALEA